MEFKKVSGSRNEHKVTLYALSTCIWCKMTKQLFNDNGIEYEYVDVDLLDEKDKEKARQAITSKGGPLRYPTTIIDDNTLITGFRKDRFKEVLGV